MRIERLALKGFSPAFPGVVELPLGDLDAGVYAITGDNDAGKRSTFDEAVRSRFPSYDVFINSSFAAQGRGDEFTRKTSGERKELCYELFGLLKYGAMAATAGDAASRAAVTRLRLEADRD